MTIAENVAGHLYVSDSTRTALRAAWRAMKPCWRYSHHMRTKRHRLYREVLAAHAANQRHHHFVSGGMYPDLDPGQ